jgi:hypothetical protein
MWAACIPCGGSHEGSSIPAAFRILRLLPSIPWLLLHCADGETARPCWSLYQSYASASDPAAVCRQYASLPLLAEQASKWVFLAVLYVRAWCQSASAVRTCTFTSNTKEHVESRDSLANWLDQESLSLTICQVKIQAAPICLFRR